MRFSRRQFVVNGAAAAAAAAHTLTPYGALAAPTQVGLTRRRAAASGVPDALAGRVDPAVVKQLALRAVDAARVAGAQYADVRLTRTVSQGVYEGLHGSFAQDDEVVAVGVRCLVNGYWGFAASPAWNPDEVAALARSAAAMAKAHGTGATTRTVEWVPVPVVTGDWSTPIEIDPFTVTIEEKGDCMLALRDSLARVRVVGKTLALSGNGVQCSRQERALATSEGTYVTQATYTTGTGFGFRIFRENGTYLDLPFKGLAPGGRGWELIRDAKLFDQLPVLIAEGEELLSLPVKPAELGRYDVVADGWTTSPLVDRTLGRATELDRALGYEANATGTSYLGPSPLQFLGTFQAGSPALTVMADRSMAGGTATVKWDDEGVVPETTTLVKDGVLVDYQTTRESASWLAPWYQKTGHPVRSHGHASAESALGITMQLAPNLSLAPASSDTSIADLTAGIKKGLLIMYGGLTYPVDFQAKTGGFGGLTREIVNGKLGSLVGGGLCLFSAVELWKNVLAVGGPSTAVTVDSSVAKGQPQQRTSFSVRGVAALFKGVTVTR